MPRKSLLYSPPLFLHSILTPRYSSLFWFGWSSRESIHWIMPIIGTGWFSIGTFFLFNSVLNYLGDAYPEYAASVLAGNDFMRSSFGAGFPLFAAGMYHQLGVPWASSLLGFLAIAFIPIPFFLYKVCFLPSRSFRYVLIVHSTGISSDSEANLHVRTFNRRIEKLPGSVITVLDRIAFGVVRVFKSLARSLKCTPLDINISINLSASIYDESFKNLHCRCGSGWTKHPRTSVAVAHDTISAQMHPPLSPPN